MIGQQSCIQALFILFKTCPDPNVPGFNFKRAHSGYRVRSRPQHNPPLRRTRAPVQVCGQRGIVRQILGIARAFRQIGDRQILDRGRALAVGPSNFGPVQAPRRPPIYRKCV